MNASATAVEESEVEQNSEKAKPDSIGTQGTSYSSRERF